MEHYSNQAFEVFAELHGRELIKFMCDMKADDFKFELESQPEAWIQYLILDRNLDNQLSLHPGSIAECIKYIFGVNMICAEISEIHQYQINILDALVLQLRFNQSYAYYNYDIENQILAVMNHLIAYGAVSSVDYST